MKTKLPLPKDSKTLPWTVDLIRDLGFPFLEGRCLSMNFSEPDIKYIKNVIQSDKRYRLLYKQGYTLADKETNEILQRCNAESSFLTPFMNDAKCPQSVKNFLYWYIGLMNGWLKEFSNQSQFSREQFLMGAWMEKVRQN